MILNQYPERVARAGARPVILSDQVISLTAPELPSEFAPQSVHLSAIRFDMRRPGLEVGADEGGAGHVEPAEVGASRCGDEFLYLLGELLGRGAGEQVVKRQHGVGLAATEVRLQVHHWACVGVAAEAPQSPRQQIVQALGEVGAGEELHRVVVLGTGRLPGVHQVQVGCELRGCELAAGDVVVRSNHFAPRFQARPRLEGHLGPVGLLTGLRLVDSALQVCAQFAHVCCRVGRPRRLEKPLDGVEGTDGVVGAERLVVRPPVAGLAQLGSEALLRPGQHFLELVTAFGDGTQLHLNVLLGQGPRGAAVTPGVRLGPPLDPLRRAEGLGHHLVHHVVQAL